VRLLEFFQSFDGFGEHLVLAIIIKESRHLSALYLGKINYAFK
jgi:hypothetical protein